MSKTARIPVLVTAEDKKHYSAIASAHGITLNEFMRRAAANYHPDDNSLAQDDHEVLSALIAEVREATTRAKKALNKGLRDANSVLKEIKRK